ncbi:hypothetical protein [Thiothrix sp.]|jgi:hypothetical protein|uniref:hypothetical protein n=1 Tax=Thiothrix sp. TaxID=1032 RepID=UPI00257DD227|nr:hypothetical protein [Thiothrix sp.]
MAWAFAIILLLLFAYFLATKPRGTLIATASIAGVVVIALYYFDLKAKAEASAEQRLQDGIEVLVKHSPTECSEDKPLLVTIKNNGDLIVSRVWWSLSITNYGHSSNIIRGYSGNNYSSDKILRKGEYYSVCLKNPIERPKKVVKDVATRPSLKEFIEDEEHKEIEENIFADLPSSDGIDSASHDRTINPEEFTYSIENKSISFVR